MSKYTINAHLKVTITTEDIDDIMCGALEGGINYWCEKVKVVGDYLGEYASEQISRGGKLLIYEDDGETVHLLDKEMLLKGIAMYLENPRPYSIITEDNNELVLDTCNADSIVCDMIIQYALFDDVIYG